MPRQPHLDAGPVPCLYANRPAQRPNCQLTAVTRYATTALCADCAARRSTLGKGHPPRPLSPRGPIDVMAWLAQTNIELHQTQITLTAAARRARTEGHTWTTIGNTLNITRQAAQQRFGQPPMPEG